MASNPVTEDDPSYVGNEFFVRKEYEQALEAYTKAIEKFPDMAKLYSNRALTYLKLERPFKALKDVDDGLKLNSDNDKLIYRKCKALLALRRFSDAGQFLHESSGRLGRLTKNKEFKALIDDMNRLKPEYERGQYDLLAMNEESKKSKILDNHADYFAWNKFEIREVDRKGRGLVVKSKIEAGELLVACKAFVFDDAVSIDGVIEKARRKLIDRPDLAEEFYRLNAGPQLGHLEQWKEGESRLIDTDRIKQIIRLNGFEAVSVFDALSILHPTTNRSNDGGLWLIPSYINHTCVDRNCIRYFVGDYMFVRATKSIESGEEILFDYVSSSISFEERQAVCRDSFGFDCQCRLCVIDRRDPIEIKRRMSEICKFMDDLGEQTALLGCVPCDISTLEKLLDEVFHLRPQRDLNYLAKRVQDAIAALTYGVHACEGLRLMTEFLEIQKSHGEYTQEIVMRFVKLMPNVARFKGRREQEKWMLEARRLAKLIYGDERLADLMFM